MKHALSFDIEDWFHIVDVPALEDRSKWDDFSSIVEDKTDLILDMLNQHDVKATFFVLGWIARKYPAIAKKIASEGHELGTHSFWHRTISEMTPEEFREDLQLSIDILQQQTGKKIKGFRAPSFSIIPGTEWALDVINELGLLYDASLFPARRGQGGYKVPNMPHRLSREISVAQIPELPMSMINFGPLVLPFSGGGYLRFWHESILTYGFKKLEKRGSPAVVYLHPRDFAPDSPRVKMPLYKGFKSYIGLSTTRHKLEMLLERFEFDTCENVLKNWFKTDNLASLY